MRRLELAAVREERAVGVDGRLRDVQAVVGALGEAEGDGDFVLCCGGLDAREVWGGELERVFDVSSTEDGVDRARPGYG